MMSSLRPKTFKDIIGQTSVKQCIKIAVESAKKRNDVVEHSLLAGPPGTGKTTFALAMANELQSNILLANGGNISSTKEVLPYLVRLKPGDILFIDEVHRVHPRVQEALFTVMEDFRFDLAKGAKSIYFEPFTLLGATTEAGMLLRPFYDRFVHKFNLELYSIEELSSIIKLNSQKLILSVTDNAIKNIAKRSKFTPRIANALLKWCRDYSVASNVRLINTELVKKAMKLKRIDNNGLDSSDRKYIRVLKKYNKPLGLNTIAAITGLSKETIENQIEPFLFKLGLIEKTSKGRKLLC